MSTPVDRAARIIATAIVHGTSSDPALEAAHALDDARMLPPAAADPFAAPGRRRPAPSPAAIAALADCRRAKRIAEDTRDVIEGMPGDPAVDAVAGEVTFVVHPRTVADWKQWLHALGVGDARGTSTGVSMIVRCTYLGVRARLVGVGVPALYSEMHARTGRTAGARS